MSEYADMTIEQIEKSDLPVSLMELLLNKQKVPE